MSPDDDTEGGSVGADGPSVSRPVTEESDWLTNFRRLWRRTKGPVVAGWLVVVAEIAVAVALSKLLESSLLALGVGVLLAIATSMAMVPALRHTLADETAIDSGRDVLGQMVANALRGVVSTVLLLVAFFGAFAVVGLVLSFVVYPVAGAPDGTAADLGVGLLIFLTTLAAIGAALFFNYRLLSGSEDIGWFTSCLREVRLAAAGSVLVMLYFGALVALLFLVNDGLSVVLGDGNAVRLSSVLTVATIGCVSGFPLLVGYVAMGATVEAREFERSSK